MEAINKLPLLAERYPRMKHISDNKLSPLMLLLEVCAEFIPGFCIKDGSAKPGPKKTWDTMRYSRLIGDVEKVKRERRCGDREACLVLVHRARKAKRGPYLPKKDGLHLNRAAASLEARLVEARQPKNNTFALFLKAEHLDPERVRVAFIETFASTNSDG
jgi:hypothetical protein